MPVSLQGNNNWLCRAGFLSAVVVAALLCCPQGQAAEPRFPPLSGRIVDAAGILDAATQQSIESKLASHESETSNQIVVATVNDLQGYDIADFGIRLARHWGIGTAEKNNGAVLLVAPKERKVRIEVGYGLEGALTDSLSGQIIRKEILPSFREGDYALGIDKGVNTMLAAIAGEYKAEPRRTRSDAERYAPLIIPFFFVFLAGGQSFARRKGFKNIARALIPAGFGGMFALLFTKSVLIAIPGAVILFGLIYYLNKRHPEKMRSHHGPNSNARREDNRYPYSGGSSGGGGFSGGGGGFGGGGASGGW